MSGKKFACMCNKDEVGDIWSRAWRGPVEHIGGLWKGDSSKMDMRDGKCIVRSINRRDTRSESGGVSVISVDCRCMYMGLVRANL
jgi:hypothetical protein